MIKRLKNGKYRASYSHGSGVNRVRRSKTCATRRECNQWLDEERVTSEGGSDVRKRMLLTDYFEWFIRLEKAGNQGLEPNTIDTYQVTNDHLKMVFSNVRLIDVDRPMLQSGFNQLGKRYSHATLTKDKCHLKSLFKIAVYNGDLRVNPMIDIKVGGTNLRVRTKASKLMPESDFRKIQDFLRNYQYTSLLDVNRFVLFVISQTGIRVGEALGLQEDDILIEKKQLRINASWDSVYGTLKRPKTMAGYRQIPVSLRCLEVILAWQDVHDRALNAAGINNSQGFLMLNKRGQLPLAKSINASYHQLQQKLNIEGGYSTHTMRHEIASLLVQKGLPVTVASRLLGHANVGVTQAYYLDILPDKYQESDATVMKIISNDD